MKKVLTILVLGLMVLSFGGCGEKDKKELQETNKKTEVQAEARGNKISEKEKDRCMLELFEKKELSTRCEDVIFNHMTGKEQEEVAARIGYGN